MTICMCMYDHTYHDRDQSHVTTLIEKIDCGLEGLAREESEHLR